MGYSLYGDNIVNVLGRVSLDSKSSSLGKIYFMVWFNKLYLFKILSD